MLKNCCFFVFLVVAVVVFLVVVVIVVVAGAVVARSIPYSSDLTQHSALNTSFLYISSVLKSYIYKLNPIIYLNVNFN